MGKKSFNKDSLKSLTAILVVAVSGSVIYGLPYLRYDYYDVYLEMYNLTNTQMGVLGSILGVFGMVSYLFGGVVADRFSTRSILTVSLVATGIGGLIHLLPLSYGALIALYAYWGVTSLFAFWPACIKAVRILSEPGQQGKAYGFFESGRGIAAALMTSAAVAVFRYGAKKMNNEALGMRYVIIFYSILTIALGIITFFMVKEDDDSKSDRISLEGIKEVLKSPAVWIISLVTFATYVFTQSFYYFTPYATSFLGASVSFGAILASVRRWFSVIGSLGGGIATDKVGTSKTLFISFVVMIVGIIAMLMLPLKEGSVTMFTILYLIVFVFYNVNSAMTWAMMDEGGIPVEYSGTATGVISTIGYLPEIFCSVLAGHLIDKNPGITGYRYYFYFLIIMLIFGAVLVVIWDKYLAKNKQVEENA